MRKEKFNYFKEFKKMNRLLDLDYNQLYDKYHDLELSHNRKKKALKKLEKMFFIVYKQSCKDGVWKWSPPAVQFVLDIIENALFTDGRAEIK